MYQQHYARRISYDELLSGLNQAIAQNHVTCRQGPNGLTLYKYTNHCMFDRGWNDYTLVARGLILDHDQRAVVATPFPKFFNLGEMGITMPDEPFDVFEKLDGSLIILFHHRDKWHAIMRGSFYSAQAEWAQSIVDQSNTSLLQPGTTYLAEAVYPENRIVIRYDEPALVLLSAYDAQGYEQSYSDLQALADAIGWRVAKRYRFASADEMIAHASTLPASEEGYVVQFASGMRLKIKGAEYSRIHALISGVTPLGVWELIQSGDDLDAVRLLIPEELWWDFDTIRAILETKINVVLDKVQATALAMGDMDDKQVGLSLGTMDPAVRPFIFAYRKYGSIMENDRTRRAMMAAVRPDGNVLDGYEPSYKMKNFVSETGI